jgi:hypothetical protein
MLATLPGWKDNNGNLEATFTQKVKGNGTGAPTTSTFNLDVVVVANPDTGAYDVYTTNKNAFGVSLGRTPLYNFNPATGKSTPYAENKSLYEQYYGGADGQQQQNTLNKSIKSGIIRNLELNATDPLVQANLDKIKQTPGYSSQGNVAPGGAGPTGPEGPAGPSQNNTQQTDAPTSADTTAALAGLANNGGIASDQQKTFEDVFSKKVLVYPEASEDQDKIQFKFVRFSPRSVDTSGSTNFNPGPRNLKEEFGTVYLPIQSGITDNNSVNWNQGELNAVDYEKVAASKAIQTNDVKKYIDSFVGRVKNASADARTKEAITLYLAGKATSTTGLLSRFGGAVLNPNLELLFQGPTLRPFDFNFKLSPRDRNEAETVKQIIRAFKQFSSPGTAVSNLFLTAPPVFQIKYIRGSNGNAAHPSLNLIKTCALKNMSVDYTPDGSYATYSDETNTMVSYNMSLSFQELEPVTQADYDTNFSTSGIGY